MEPFVPRLRARDFGSFPEDAKKNGKLATIWMLEQGYWTKCNACGLIIRSITSKCSNPGCRNFSGKNKVLQMKALQMRELSCILDDLCDEGLDDVANGLCGAVEHVDASAAPILAATAVIPGQDQQEPGLV